LEAIEHFRGFPTALRAIVLLRLHPEDRTLRRVQRDQSRTTSA